MGGLIAAVAAVAFSVANFGSLGKEETKSANWGNVEAATQSGRAMQWVAAGGAAEFTNEMIVGDADEDVKTTAAIREAIERGDFAAADAIFAAAQSIQMVPSPKFDAARPAPDVDVDVDVGGTNSPAVADSPPQIAPDAVDVEVSADPVAPQPYQPTLTSGMRTEIANGDAKFFHIHLRDSCWNDGDVVEILLNGQPAFLVPITNAGATLSVPVTSGTAMVISVRGVYDGGGGITVACRTSRGEGFVRVMAPGEIQPLGVVFQ